MKPNFRNLPNQNTDIRGIFQRPAEIPVSTTGLANLGLLQRRNRPWGKVHPRNIRIDLFQVRLLRLRKRYLTIRGCFCYFYRIVITLRTI